MKKILSVALLVLAFGISNAELVSKQEARKICNNFFTSRHCLANSNNQNKKYFARELTEFSLGIPVFYIFCYDELPGFVIVSAESNTFPVLAYSYESSWDESNLSPGLKLITENYISQINYIRDYKIIADKSVNDLWEKYRKPIITKEPLIAVNPMLTTKWGQGCYYNALCPYDASATGYCSHAVVGCLPLAMAQVMKYHKHPVNGVGSYTYNYGSYTNITANFAATTYNWNNMPDNLTSSNNNIATICFHAGVAVGAMYGPSGTPADFYNGLNALKTTFKYKNTAILASKSSYTDFTWAALIKADIDNGHPAIYIATDPSKGGHGWVVDGYQGNGGNTDYFHFNWGWNGWEDGYFLLNDLTPGNYNFTQNIKAIVHIEPQLSFVDEEIENEKISIFPNPATNYFKILLPENLKSDNNFFSLFEINGKKAIEKYISENDQTTFYISALNRGIYFYQLISSSGKSYSGKIILSY